MREPPRHVLGIRYILRVALLARERVLFLGARLRLLARARLFALELGFVRAALLRVARALPLRLGCHGCRRRRRCRRRCRGLRHASRCRWCRCSRGTSHRAVAVTATTTAPAAAGGGTFAATTTATTAATATTSVVFVNSRASALAALFCSFARMATTLATTRTLTRSIL